VPMPLTTAPGARTVAGNNGTTVACAAAKPDCDREVEGISAFSS
jgi:hypothetical protein